MQVLARGEILLKQWQDKQKQEATKHWLPEGAPLQRIIRMDCMLNGTCMVAIEKKQRMTMAGNRRAVLCIYGCMTCFTLCLLLPTNRHNENGDHNELRSTSPCRKRQEPHLQIS